MRPPQLAHARLLLVLLLALVLLAAPLALAACPADIANVNDVSSTIDTALEGDGEGCTQRVADSTTAGVMIAIADGATGFTVEVTDVTCGTNDAITIMFDGAAEDVHVVVSGIAAGDLSTVMVMASGTLTGCSVTLEAFNGPIGSVVALLENLEATSLVVRRVEVTTEIAVLATHLSASTVAFDSVTFGGAELAIASTSDPTPLTLDNGSNMTFNNVVCTSVPTPDVLLALATLVLTGGSTILATGADSVIGTILALDLTLADGAQFIADGVGANHGDGVSMGIFLMLMDADCGQQACLIRIARSLISDISVGRNQVDDLPNASNIMIQIEDNPWNNMTNDMAVDVGGAPHISIINTKQYKTMAVNSYAELPLTGSVELWGNVGLSIGLSLEAFTGALTIVNNTIEDAKPRVFIIYDKIMYSPRELFVACNTVYNSVKGLNLTELPCDYETRIPRCTEGFPFYFNASGHREDPPTSEGNEPIASCLDPQVWWGDAAPTEAPPTTPSSFGGRANTKASSTAGALTDGAKAGIVVAVCVGVPLAALLIGVGIYFKFVRQPTKYDAGDIDGSSNGTTPPQKKTSVADMAVHIEVAPNKFNGSPSESGADFDAPGMSVATEDVTSPPPSGVAP